MKTKTKKIVLNVDGSFSKNIKNALNNTRFKDNKLYTDTWIGSGSRKSLRSTEKTIIEILNSQGYKFTKGNDALRGGAEGNYIKVSKVALNFLNSLR